MSEKCNIFDKMGIILDYGVTLWKQLETRKPVFRVIRYGSNQPAQLQRQARILKFCLKKV